MRRILEQMEKNQLRKKYKELRAQLSDAALAEQSLLIANNVLQLNIWDHTYYHLFLSIENQREIETDLILHILQGKEKSIVIPKAHFETSKMTHFLLQDNTQLRVSEYGIPEPVAGIEIAPSQIEVVFVPLLAFDKNGNRIGYGKGFYDLFLAQCSPDCIKVGLSLFSAEEHIKTREQDVALDFCVTPERVYEFNR